MFIELLLCARPRTRHVVENKARACFSPGMSYSTNHSCSVIFGKHHLHQLELGPRYMGRGPLCSLCWDHFISPCTPDICTQKPIVFPLKTSPMTPHRRPRVAIRISGFGGLLAKILDKVIPFLDLDMGLLLDK